MSVPSSPSASPSWSGGRRNSQQRNSGPKSAGEPPRPARDGYEWVWFPEGYWAERPLECRRSSNKSQASSTVGKRLLSWTPRSRPTPRDATHDAFGTPTTPGIGGISDSDHDVLLTPRGFTPVSPMSSQSQRMSYLMMNRGLPQSPYLSEQEQVAALQNPLAVPREIDSEDTWKSSSPPEEPAEEAAARTRRGTMAAIGPMNLWRSMHNHHHQHRVRVSAVITPQKPVMIVQPCALTRNSLRNRQTRTTKNVYRCLTPLQATSLRSPSGPHQQLHLSKSFLAFTHRTRTESRTYTIPHQNHTQC